MTLTSVLVLTWVASNIVTSQVGRNWMAIRDMETAAAVGGIPVGFNKLAAFAISSFILGLLVPWWGPLPISVR